MPLVYQAGCAAPNRSSPRRPSLPQHKIRPVYASAKPLRTTRDTHSPNVKLPLTRYPLTGAMYLIDMEFMTHDLAARYWVVCAEKRYAELFATPPARLHAMRRRRKRRA